MGRNPCCPKVGLNRGAWTAAEDKILTDFIKLHGEGRWRTLPKRAGLKRCGKSCRLRWLNYLRPDIKRGNITWDEEELIVRLHKLLGNKWSLIAGRLPGRTDNEIKNYWNTNLRKKVDENDPNKTRKSTKNESISTVLVVRTKATKCSKRFTGQYENIKKTDNNNNSSNSNSNNKDSSFVVNDLRDARPAGFHNEVQQNSLSFMRQDDHNDACVLDDDLLNISDVLNSVELWGDQELFDGDKKGKGPFCDEMQLQDWFDAQDFTQIPDFGGDWLANISIL